MKEYINYYSESEQQEAKKYFGEMIGAYMLQEQDEDNPKLVIRKDDIEKLKALLFMVENLINRNKEIEEILKDNWEFRDKYYIPKSKIKEKIEELKNKSKYCSSDELREYSQQIQVLEELLREEK